MATFFIHIGWELALLAFLLQSLFASMSMHHRTVHLYAHKICILHHVHLILHLDAIRQCLSSNQDPSWPSQNSYTQPVLKIALFCNKCVIKALSSSICHFSQTCVFHTEVTSVAFSGTGKGAVHSASYLFSPLSSVE